VAVYPEFERFDIAPIHRLRPKPLRDPRFVADAHLGTLARFMRLLGFDTIYDTDLTDETLATLTARERRILLTRDVGLLKRKTVVRGHWLRDRNPERQLEEVVQALHLERMLRPFSRCMICNGRLSPLPRAQAATLVPSRAYRRYRVFLRCGRCGRAYWRGTHYIRLRALVSRIRRREAAPIRAGAEPARLAAK